VKRGLSLVETLIACFLLSLAVLAVTVLFHTSMRYQRNLEIRGRALLLATKKLAEIRAWAKASANFASNWAPYRGTSSYDASAPLIRIDCDCNDRGRTLYSPCQSLEIARGSDARTMTRSVVPIRVTAAWGAASKDRVSLFSYVSQPVPSLGTRQASTLVINPISGPVGPAATTPLGVTGSDGSGQTLNDFFFRWRVVAADGNARIAPGSRRDGRVSGLQNLYEFSSTVPPAPVPGNVTVRCLTHYHGTIIRADSPLVEMR